MLTILGLVAVVVFPIQVYKSARNTGRNAAFWTVLTAVIGIGFQFVLPFFIGLVIAVVMIAGGTPPENVAVDSYGLFLVIGIVSLILSLGGMYLVSRHVSIVPDDPPSVAGPKPPPPPAF
jgi:hypothetical protein